MSPNAVGLVNDCGATVAADQFGAMIRGRLVVMARGSKIADGGRAKSAMRHSG